MAKKKRKSSKKGASKLTYIAIVLGFLAAVIVSLVAGYYMGYSDAEYKVSKMERQKEKKRLAILQKLEETSSSNCDKSVTKRLKEVLEKDIKEPRKKKKTTIITASHEIDVATLPKAIKRDVTKVFGKPKLAIIIDDVSVISQVRAIKSLDLPITMSFLPPSKNRPNSPSLAAKESFYMVHLPMEAMSFTKEEPFTLRVADSQRIIQERINKIKELFPKVRYINNHTGSKFTSDEMAVNRLVFALRKQGISFIDSRTIASTKVPKVMKNYGLKYMARDVFLDHEMDKAYVKNQIKKAVQIAKAHGTAIAIGHPHVNTILAISESKKLFKDVDLVLVDKLY
jgi:polysaccharide deacetylase 2 family uncharacterized protein YibQ